MLTSRTGRTRRDRQALLQKPHEFTSSPCNRTIIVRTSVVVLFSYGVAPAPKALGSGLGIY